MVASLTSRDAKVPIWEQELSTGAVCMNLEHAAGAFGYSASWITDWYSYDSQAAALFGVQEGETIAGFIHIGTARIAAGSIVSPRNTPISRPITTPGGPRTAPASASTATIPRRANSACPTKSSVSNWHCPFQPIWPPTNTSDAATAKAPARTKAGV